MIATAVLEIGRKCVIGGVRTRLLGMAKRSDGFGRIRTRLVRCRDEGRSLMLQLHSIEEFTATGVPVTLMSCVGTFSDDDSSRLWDQLRVQMRHGSRHLLLDLTDVTSADRLDAALLADANSQARAAACTLTVIAPNLYAVPGLDLGGLNWALPVYPDLTQALTALDISDNDQ